MNIRVRPKERELTAPPSSTLAEGRAKLAALLAQLPLTGRGWILLVGIIFLLLGPVTRSADIISAAFAWSALAVLVVLVISRTYQSVLLRRSLALTIHSPQDPQLGAELGEVIYLYSSGIEAPEFHSSPSDALTNSQAAEALRHQKVVLASRAVQLVVRTTPLRVLPLFQLLLQIDLTCGSRLILRHTLSGSALEQRTSQLPVTCPHRGGYRIVRCSWLLTDLFGLTAARSQLQLLAGSTEITVLPPPFSCEELPLVSSSTREGDLSVDLRHRRGDPYDLKQYHPSDGLRRVAWKIFARTEKLVARHPEPAADPGGRCAVLCLASKEEDEVASICAHYLGAGMQAGIDLYLGTPRGYSEQALNGIEEGLLRLSREVDWENPPSELAEQLQGLISAAAPAEGDLQKLVVFVGSQNFSNSGWEQQLAVVVEQLPEGCEPVWMVIANGQSKLLGGLSTNPLAQTGVTANSSGSQVGAGSRWKKQALGWFITPAATNSRRVTLGSPHETTYPNAVRQSSWQSWHREAYPDRI